MAKEKIKDLGKSLENPKNTRKIEETEIASKYARVTNEKGSQGLSPHFSYLITDEWTEILKPRSEKLPESERYYLGLITVLYDRNGEPVRKGSVSVNRLTQPLPSYSDDGIQHIQPIRNIPSFEDAPVSMIEYLKEHVIGKYLRNTGEVFNTIMVDYSYGTPSLYSINGEKLRERQVAFYEAEEVKEETE